MKQVAVEEFKERSLDYLTSGETLEIEHDGKVVGYYFPKEKAKPEESKRALEQFNQAVEAFLAQTGMTEEELAEALDSAAPLQL